MSKEEAPFWNAHNTHFKAFERDPQLKEESCWHFFRHKQHRKPFLQ